MNRKMIGWVGLGAAGLLLIALGIAGLRRGPGTPASPAVAPQAAPARAVPAQPEPSPASSTAPLTAPGVGRYFSTAVGPGDATYAVQPGDTLTRIARKNGITVELLRVSNGIRGDMIRVGQRLKVPKANFSVVVDKSQNTLTLKDGEEVVKIYRCSTGREGITPPGTFRIVNRMVDPVWKGVVNPGDPKNPLGTRWLGFDLPQYGIHGTNDPESIGKAVTDGCVRLANNDVEELYTLLAEGTSVTVVE